MSSSSHSLDRHEITVKRYHPPTTERLTTIAQDIDFARRQADLEKSVGLLGQIATVCLVAAELTNDNGALHYYKESVTRAEDLRYEKIRQHAYLHELPV